MSMIQRVRNVVVRLRQPVAGAFARLKDWRLQLLLAALVAWALFSWGQDIVYALTAKDGQIIVGSPTVYTRQRLVNDRLAQAAWLNDQLLITKNQDLKQPFRSIDQVRVRTVASAIKTDAAVGAEGGSSRNQSSTADDSSAQKPEAKEAAIPTVDPTTSDLFRAKNAYREEVRAEMMETQLDDRHDIRGNTLYRLAFNAAVLAGTRKDSLAVVTVKVSHDWEDEHFENDYKELYAEWLRHMQRLLDESVPEVSKSLTFRSTPGALQLTLPTVLSRGVCWHMILLHMIKSSWSADTQKTHGGRRSHPCNANPASDEMKEAQRSLQLYVEAYLAKRRDYMEGQARARILQVIKVDKTAIDKGVIAALESRCRAKAQQGVLDDPTKITASLEDIFPRSGEISCPLYDSPLEGLYGGIMLHEKLSRASATPNSKKTFLNLLDELKGSCSSCLPPEPTPFDLSCFAADYMLDSMNSFWDGDVEEWERLNYFVNTRVVGRELGDCKLVLSKGTYRPVFLDGEEKNRTESVRDQPADAVPVRPSFRRDPCERMFPNDPEGRLKCRLNISGSEIFSYSISPKSLMQRISTTSDTRDAFQTALNARVDVLGKNSQSLIEILKKNSDTAHAIEANPIVVGFGLSKTSEMNQPFDIPASRTIEAEFGWVISPELRVNGERAQVDGEYALAAIISLPSWWRSVRLEITRCWVMRRELHSVQDFKQCPAKLESPPEYVRLPGDIHGISEKLRFDVDQEPHLDNDVLSNLITLDVGQRGDVILKGGRLWRSTEVTLGSQKADEIVVLPNMEGIIATFRCVRRQTPSTVDVRVWTSEGVTNLPIKAILNDPAAERRKGSHARCSGEQADIAGPGRGAPPVSND